MPGAPVVVIVAGGDDTVEADLRAGLLACPDCRGELRPWGHGKARPLRRGELEELIRPRRSICPACRSGSGRGATHMLLPDSSLIRRRDHVEVIFGAIEASAAGESRANIASRIGRDLGTVRGWLRSFTARLEVTRSFFTRLAAALEPSCGPVEPERDAVHDALAAIGVAVRAAVLSVDGWRERATSALVSLLSGGALLCNARFPYRAAGML
jgi:hypothetical protein